VEAGFINHLCITYTERVVSGLTSPFFPFTLKKYSFFSFFKKISHIFRVPD
jgi:hypothetical protein